MHADCGAFSCASSVDNVIAVTMFLVTPNKGCFMGYQKNKADEEREHSEGGWAFVAERDGHRCSICGELPSFEDRTIYFETKMCGYHAHSARKDD